MVNKDSVTNVSKSNFKLYVAGKAISRSSFNYDRARNLLAYTSPKVPAGKKEARS